ncbi:MAG: Hsp20/alpha crystallin family protein [Gammaproteobacteria bacterium]|jgi:HSP20 family protein
MTKTKDIESVLVKEQELSERRRPEQPLFEMERLFNRLFPARERWPRLWADLPGFAEWAPQPRIDVIDEKAAVVVRAEVPGVEKDDLNVTLTDDNLTISGHTHHEERKEEGEMLYQERREGEFSRTIPLPAHVDGGKAKARYRDGMLELTLPKTEVSKRRKIEIEAS